MIVRSSCACNNLVALCAVNLPFWLRFVIQVSSLVAQITGSYPMRILTSSPLMLLWRYPSLTLEARCGLCACCASVLRLYLLQTSVLHDCLQEVYQQTHPVLFSDRAIYVIVYSLRAEVSLVQLFRHLMNVTTRCKDAPIILVGTHLDVIGTNQSLPLPALKSRFPQVGVCYLAELDSVFRDVTGTNLNAGAVSFYLSCRGMRCPPRL
jgi:hypothetical protein